MASSNTRSCSKSSFSLVPERCEKTPTNSIAPLVESSTAFSISAGQLARSAPFLPSPVSTFRCTLATLPTFLAAVPIFSKVARADAPSSISLLTASSNFVFLPWSQAIIGDLIPAWRSSMASSMSAVPRISTPIDSSFLETSIMPWPKASALTIANT